MRVRDRSRPQHNMRMHIERKDRLTLQFVSGEIVAASLGKVWDMLL